MLTAHPETVGCDDARVGPFVGDGPGVCTQGAPFVWLDGYLARIGRGDVGCVEGDCAGEGGGKGMVCDCDGGGVGEDTNERGEGSPYVC